MEEREQWGGRGLGFGMEGWFLLILKIYIVWLFYGDFDGPLYYVSVLFLFSHFSPPPGQTPARGTIADTPKFRVVLLLSSQSQAGDE